MPRKKDEYGVVIRGRFFPVEDKPTWLRLRQVLDTYIDLLESQENFLLEEFPADSSVSAPETSADTEAVRIHVTQQGDAPGTLAIDALLLALDAQDGPLTYTQAATAVQSYGWNLSTSARPDTVISGRAKRYSAWVTAAQGKFTLTPQGRIRAMQVRNALNAPINKSEEE